jgi:hypothetical protein
MSFWSEYTKEELEYIPVKHLTNPLGLTREAWKFKRGAKTERHYTKDGITYIKVEYTYTYPDDGQGGDDLRKITGYTENIYLLESDESIFHTIPVPVALSGKNLKEINRAIRFGRIDYMYSAGEQLTAYGATLPDSPDQATVDAYVAAGGVHPSYNTPALFAQHKADLLNLQNDMEAIFAHYSQEIYDYKDRGTTDFYDAVKAETDQAILDILDTDLPPDSYFTSGFKVEEAIDYQLRGI